MTDQPTSQPLSDADLLTRYARILRQLPRQAAAEFVAAVISDPELKDRKTTIAQAAVLVSAGRRLGWGSDQPAGTGETRQPKPADTVRDDLLHAIDFNYTVGVLGYATPEQLLDAYDASREQS
ncbi:hypothetical protein [Streptomyces sp. PD-S100-1]|uniref:hypothetical protein n=1 Tax=Streptomyces sp. PD-S100-1 TaxID=3394351 RepID=UPI0039BD3BA7